MTDFKLPELPSDEELGITQDDLDAFERERSGEPPPGDEPPPEKPETGPAHTTADDLPPRWRGFATLLVLVALAWVASIRTGLPRPLPIDAPDTTFSAARAATLLREIAQSPRPTGSPEHARVRAYLVAQLAGLGLEPSIQTTTALVEGPGYARAATVRNVLARWRGTDPTGSVLVTAHYDGAELSPAAGDDASGLVTILEALRALRAGAPLRNDVIVLFTDAEELGLMGAEAFVREHPWVDDVRAVIGFEMRGTAGPSLLFETADRNGAVVRALSANGEGTFGTSLGDGLYPYMPHRTDFTVFERAGKQGLNFAAIDRASVYHTPRDRPSELSSETLQHHGLHALASLRGLGGMDLTDIYAPDVVYFSLPGFGLITYPAAWSIPIAISLVLLAAATLFLARRRGARPSAMVLGLGLSIVSVSLGYGAGIVLIDQVDSVHAEAGRLPAALFYGEGWYVLALTALGLFVVTVLFGIARRRTSVAELALGALVLPLGVTVVASVLVPIAAAPLQWATFSAVGGIFAYAVLGSRADGKTAWILGLLMALPVIGFLVPTGELLWLAATLRQAGALAAFIVMCLLLLIPALDALRRPNGWWAPLLSLLVAAGAVGLARLGSEVSPVTPQPVTLVYGYERGADRGVWITDPQTAEADDTATAVGRWLAERVGVPFERTADWTEAGYGDGPVPVADAPPAVTPPPSIRIERDTTVGVLRHLTLAVRSEAGAERLYFRPSGGARGTRITAVDGRSISDPFAIRWVDHWGTPVTDVLLELEVPAGSDADLVVSEHHLRPGEILGPGTFQRPPGVEADVMRGSDRAIFTTLWGSNGGTRPAASGSGPEAEPEPGDTTAPTPAPGDTTAPAREGASAIDTSAAPSDSTMIAAPDGGGDPC
jgi:hypothetical protein